MPEASDHDGSDHDGSDEHYQALLDSLSEQSTQLMPFLEDERATPWDTDQSYAPPGMCRTEKGALAEASTGSPVLDLFFQAVPGIAPAEFDSLMRLAWDADPSATLRVVFNLGNCRKGQVRQKEGGGGQARPLTPRPRRSRARRTPTTSSGASRGSSRRARPLSWPTSPRSRRTAP